jgi:L-malate glycosyltransferase
LAAADVFLLTSISEGIPVTLIEAMAARLPVVSTAVGGIREVVVDAETGWTAPAGDDENLAALTLRVLGERAKAKALGLAGESRARELFSEQQMHSAYARLFTDMLPRRVRRGEQRLAQATA